jgi:hypothetical protein
MQAYYFITSDFLEFRVGEDDGNVLLGFDVAQTRR